MDGHRQPLSSDAGRTGCGFAWGADFLTNAASGKNASAATCVNAPGLGAHSCQVPVMDFLDDDDDFLKGLPSLVDWCPSPRGDARQHLPGAATAPQSTVLPVSCQISSGFLDDLGPWALSVPHVPEQQLLASAATCLQHAEQVPQRKLIPPNCDIEWMDMVPTDSFSNHDSGSLMCTWQPQQQPQSQPQSQPQPQLQQEPKWGSAPAPELLPTSLPWPWTGSMPSDGAAGMPRLQQLRGFGSAGTHPDLLAPRSAFAGQAHQQRQAPAQRHRLQRQQQQLLSCLNTMGGRSCTEEDMLLAEIEAAPWPSSKTLHNVTTAAYEAAAALANARLSPATVPPPPPAAACGAAQQPATGSLSLPSTMYSCFGAATAPASAPPTPVLSPPPLSEHCALVRRLPTVPEVGQVAGDAALLPPRAASAPESVLQGYPLLQPQPGTLAVPAAAAAAANRTVAGAVNFGPSLTPMNQRPSLRPPQPQPVRRESLACSPFLSTAMAAAPPPSQAVAAVPAVGVKICTREPAAVVTATAAAQAPVSADVPYEDHMHVQPSEDAGSDCEIDGDDGAAAHGGSGGGAASTAAAGAAASGELRRGGGGRAGGSGRPGGRVTLEALRDMFDLPVQEVVRALGISATDLKRRCRALGIQRWPQRKLMSLRRLAEAVETDIELTEEERKEMLERVARNRAEILADPDAELEARLKPVRQQHYKRNFVDRRSTPRS